MNFSYVIKALIISFTAFILIYAISVIGTQKEMLDSNNYDIRNSLKEAINVATYRVNGDIAFNNEKLIQSVLSNYVKDNNIKVDDITFEIAVDEIQNIVSVSIYTEKEILDSKSKANYTFSYKVLER